MSSFHTTYDTPGQAKAAAPVRTLIVDDSRTMRGLIRSVLERDPRIVIVAEAGNASEARDAVNAHQPDVMTLDIEMPSMSGLEFLDRLMRHRPMPVVMVSTLTKAGSVTAIDALSKGAVECVQKPTIGQGGSPFAGLADILVAAASARIKVPTSASPARPASTSGRKFHRICLLGGSTGAVDAIEQILLRFPADCPPTLITQHMPEPFLASFAARLNPLVAPTVRLARDGDELRNGEVLIAPGGDFHLNLLPGLSRRVSLFAGPNVSGHRPSVDSMFHSASHLSDQIVAGILTGMGRDGAEGLANLRAKGAITLAQSRESCVVFGMPRVAGEMDGVDNWVHLDTLGDALLKAAETPVGAKPR
ncbi:chemotaxis-specific protein-glutamate methyltransferase CheB [Celeribacter sp.]|uniref:chemotaxis-specific protein-glutamate methyltransferase CheB n=1 Tax=Celeribacter sp. TaxID=1890673 RepID=UPI003A92924B